MYKLYLDRQEDFICEISVKNASLKNSMARMIVKSDDIILLFEGRIENGKCIVPIRRLKGLVNENVTGNMKLEVVVEDTYFSPWSDQFITEEHTSVKVRVDENKKSSKPAVEVKIPSNTTITHLPTPKRTTTQVPGANAWIPLHEISKICEKFGIKKKNIVSRKSDLAEILKEYFSFNPEFLGQKTIILNGLKNFLK